MRTRTTPRSTRPAAVLAAAVAPLALVASASAAVMVSTTPTTVYTAGSAGYTTLTVGLSSSSNTAAIIDQDPSVISGYETKTGLRSIYYLTPATGAVTTVAIPDNTVATSPFHVTGTGTPTLVQVSSGGTLYGSQTRTNVAGGTTSLGTDAFTYTPTTSTTGTYNVTTVPTAVLGGGASYTYTATSGTTTLGTVYRFNPTTGSINPTSSTGNQIGTDGSVTGTITRVVGDANATTNNPNSTPLGSDAFYLSPTGTTTAIGFTGPIGTTGETYDQLGQDTDVPSLITHTTSVTGMAGTAAVGTTTRYASGTASFNNGTDAFRYTPATGTVQIGLVGGIYTNGFTEISTPTRTNTAGQIAGTSVIENSTTSTGTDAWLYTPSTTTPGTAATFGTSTAGTYVRLGLTATPTATAVGNVNLTTGNRLSRVAFLEPNGTASGVSSRYDTSGTSQGSAAYYFNGTTNIDISPADAGGGIHPVVNGGTVASTNTITAMNNSGMVAAVATRFSTAGVALGQDAYVYDGATSTPNTPFFVDPTDESNASLYEFSTIGAISDQGEAVGYYETFSGTTASTVTGAELFVWNETTGIENLMALGVTTTTQASALAPYIDSFTFGPDGTLYGPNTFSSGTTNVETSIVAFTAVPEPASAGLLAVAAVGTLARRRRRSA